MAVTFSDYKYPMEQIYHILLNPSTILRLTLALCFQSSIVINKIVMDICLNFNLNLDYFPRMDISLGLSPKL